MSLVEIQCCFPLSCPHDSRTKWRPAGCARRTRLAWTPAANALSHILSDPSWPLPQLYHIVPGPPAAFNNLNDGQVFITALKPKTITVREIYAVCAAGVQG